MADFDSYSRSDDGGVEAEQILQALRTSSRRDRLENLVVETLMQLREIRARLVAAEKLIESFAVTTGQRKPPRRLEKLAGDSNRADRPA